MSSNSDSDDREDRMSAGTGATTGAAPGTIMGNALGGPIGVAAGGALGGAAEEAVGGTTEEESLEALPQTSGYTRGYKEDIAPDGNENITLDFSGTTMGSEPITGAPPNPAADL